VSEWQPISTAPKDGRVIIVFRKIHGWNVLGYAYWESVRGIDGWISNGFSDPPGNLGLAHPTHWCPLPPPPKGEGS